MNRPDERVELVACGYCGGPMVRGSGKCPACATPEGGKEFPYIHCQESRPEVAPLVKWWAIWSFLIWAFAGFSFGKISSLLFAVLTAVYLVRIMRRWFAD